MKMARPIRAYRNRTYRNRRSRGDVSQTAMCRSATGVMWPIFSANARQPTSGFTLTEVLVVAVVLGVLISFIVATAFSALTRGHEFAIQSETGKLALAMETFRQEYGSHPPANLRKPDSDDDPDPLYQFVARAFPRYLQRLATDPNLAGTLQERLRSDLQRTQAEGGKGLFLGEAHAEDKQNEPHEFCPPHALLFWLVGFSGDPSDPFAGHRERMKGEDLSRAFYAFDPERIGKRYDDEGTAVGNDEPQRQEMDTQLTAIYIPDTSGGGTFTDNSVAFLYFDRGSYDMKYKGFLPYRTASGPIKPQSFQIVNAGLDRKIGEGGVARSGDDADNAAHFSDRLMGDE